MHREIRLFGQSHINSTVALGINLAAIVDHRPYVHSSAPTVNTLEFTSFSQPPCETSSHLQILAMNNGELPFTGAPSYLLPAYSLLSTAAPLAEIRGKSIYSRRLERLWAFIEKCYAEPDIRLTDAARHSGTSPDHLNRLLQRFASTTVHDLLSRYRIEKCLELIHKKNYTLTEIYSRCGFNSATTFDRQFKKWVGCLPSEYKKRMTPLESTQITQGDF